jgi:predicted nucleic acid-binding protein
MDMTWLIDKSAIVRLGMSPDAAQWADRIGRGLVNITTITLLEVGYSARTGQDLRSRTSRPPLSMMLIDYLTPGIEQRALEVQQRLADLGQHRAPGIADLLVAAVAERVGHTVLHLDKDFELISSITGQPTERLRID